MVEETAPADDFAYAGDAASTGAVRLAILKALGDNTRYAIYLELARSQAPRSTSEIADTLGLHPNTVRPHLERMREVGLLAVEVDNRGSVGRPQHRYSLADGAPSLGFEPPAYPTLAHMLVQAALNAGISPEAAAVAARAEGRERASRAPRKGCVAALTGALAELGFDPAVATEGDLATIAFTHCPYQELAESHPDLVCNLHRGLIEGFVEEIGGASVERFRTLADRDPCQVELSVR
ncbi:MAG: helix-turn-helix transcriptional regulator [Acidimicrobiales bacterium]